MSKFVLAKFPGQEFPDSMECMKQQQQEEQQYDTRTAYISIDPVMRVWLSGAKTQFYFQKERYLPALKLGDTIHAFCISQKGEQYYFGTSGLRSSFDSSEQHLLPIPKRYIDVLLFKNYTPGSFVNLTLNGLTASVGLIEACELKRGQRLVVSTAAGATGIMAVQIGINYDCQVIALTSAPKIKFLQEQFPSITVLDYNDPNLVSNIERIFPKGINAYYDNVGGQLLDDMLPLMADFGRIALCGATSTYKNYQQRSGLTNVSQIIFKRLTLKGITFNSERMFEHYDRLIDWIEKEKLKLYETYYDGMESVPKAIQTVFKGQNIGKIIVKLQPKL